MKSYEKTFAILVMAAFIIPNLYIIYNGKESFPFTHAPMFGHYVGDETNFYDFKFVAEYRDTEEQVFPSHKAINTANDVYIFRFFLNNIYGSVEEKAPFGRFENDSKEKFERRLESFFKAYFYHIIDDTLSIEKIRLEVNQYDRSYKFKKSHIVGNYVVSTKEFNHLWKENL